MQLLLAALAGCQQMPQMTVPTLPGLGPHKIDIQQGNVITQEMIDKLQPGMTRNQVRFILGTPLLVDPFRTDRWDYVYSMKKGGEVIEQRQLRVFFIDDKMVRYDGDGVASAKPQEKPVAAAAKTVVKPEPKSAAAPATGQAEPVARVREPIPEVGKPKLQLVPGPGDAAKPVAAEAAKPIAQEPPTRSAAEQGIVAPPLDAPPMPRLTMKPEEAEPASPFAPPSAPDSKSAVVTKPQTKPGDKASSESGFFGRLFGGSSASKPAQAEVAPKPSAPSPASVPMPAEKPVNAQPATKSVVAPLAVKPEIKPQAQPAEKPAPTASGRGFFGRLQDAVANPTPPTGLDRAERFSEPGMLPPPFIDPVPKPK